VAEARKIWGVWAHENQGEYLVTLRGQDAQDTKSGISTSSSLAKKGTLFNDRRLR
jgi:hypothetical protein